MFDKINLNEIIPVDYNPRIISDKELDNLTNSINVFGFVDPIIVNLKNNHIIGGHQRFKVLQTQKVKELNILKLGDVGWCFPDVDLSIDSDEHEKALNVALNKISGDWDNKKLDDLLIELDSKDFNIQLTGFNEIDITDDVDDLYDFLEEENIDESGQDLDYQNEGKRITVNNLSFPKKNIIPLGENEYNKLVEVYEDYIEKNGNSHNFVTYIIGDRV